MGSYGNANPILGHSEEELTVLVTGFGVSCHLPMSLPFMKLVVILSPVACRLRCAIRRMT
jgi:hypothetical protein